MPRKNIILTFDYELFLGKNLQSAQDVLAIPTTKLLAKLSKEDIKATFFIDLTYLLRMQDFLHIRKNEISKNDLKTLENEQKIILKNIDQITLQGHELGIHFHPQWKDAVYKNGMWTFDSFENYALHNLTEDERENLFSTGVDKFKELYTRTNTSCPSALCFRAGGWCIHPFAQLRELFLKHGITVDSSVTIPYFRTPYFYPGNIPKPANYLRQKMSWRFSSDPLIEDTAGEFLEIPIDTCFSTLVDVWKAQSTTHISEWRERGTFIPGETGIRKKLLRLKKFFQLGEQTMLTLDVDNVELRFSQLQHLLTKTNSDKGFIFLSHPKQFGSHSIKMLDKLIASNQFRFLRLSDYALQSEK